MPSATAVKPRKLKQKTIEPNTLLETLYTYYSLSQLEAMLDGEPDKLLLQNWKVTDDVLRSEVEKAIVFVKND